MFDALASGLLGCVAMHAPGTLVDHLGHTAFAVEREGYRVLIDPILARRELDLRASACAEWQAGLERVSAVLLSHGHDDHLHPPSLLGLPAGVAVHFLDEPADTCSCDRAPADVLTGLGFGDLRPFQPGDQIPLGGGLSFEAVAAAPSAEGEAQVCFVVESPDLVLLDAVDIKDSPETRAALARHRGNVDVAFVPTGAAVQWQGFWNQMDAVEAVEFCRWLRPKRVASCGGTLSLGERPRPDTLERYPIGRAEWLAVAGRALPPEQLLPWNPPFRLRFEERTLRRVSMPSAAHALPPHPGTRPQATLAAAFSGYDPLRPHRRACRTPEDITVWLEALAPVRDAIAASPVPIVALLRRCGLADCRLPAAVLAPCTLRFLLPQDEVLAGRVAALCPAPVQDPADLECTFFEAAEALVRAAAGGAMEPSVADDALSCLWIDRWMFRLFGVHARMRRLADRPAPEAEALRDAHIDGLRASLRQRRPVLGAHHFRLDARGAALLRGEPSPPGGAGVLCFASADGVQQASLSGLDALFLDLCDGRTVEEMARDAGVLLDRPPAEIEGVLVRFLTGLTRASVLVLDWSAA